jgi:uncharacterized RDD family membrane protein YckC
VLAALLLLGGLAGHAVDAPGGVLAAGLVVAAFLVQFGYDVLFETLGSGRTPGKRWTGLRVVMKSGGPVGFVASSVRNILRIVDALPGFYLVAILSVLFTSNNQRLGDLAAGTLVVRERRQARALPPSADSPARPTDADAGLWDVSAVSADEVATVRRFLERRATLTPDARERLAHEMATRLAPKVAGPPRHWQAEAFLEYLVSAKGARR